MSSQYSACRHAFTLLVLLTVAGPATAAPPHKQAYMSLSADGSDYMVGDTALISWASTNTMFCQASGDWNGKMATEGVYRTPPLDGPKTYTLKCNAQGGGVEQTINLNVSAPATATPAVPMPEVHLSAATTTIDSGGSTTLSWSADNATGCSASGGWSGTRATSGTETVAPTSDTTYTLSCSGDGGSASASATVAVNAVAPELTFNAAASSVPGGESTTVSWTASHADGCTASGDWSGSRATSGTETIGPVDSSTTLTLSCTGAGGTVVEMLSIAAISPVSLQWQAPTENTDGTALTDLAGYRIHYGTISGSYSSRVEVADPAATSHDLSLASGTYYIVMTALDSDGNESSLSNEVSKAAP